MVDQSGASIIALPFELLEEITLIAIGHYSDLGFLHPDITDTHAGPAKYSQICSWWRSVVLASPRAWSDIAITKPYSTYDLNRLERHLDLVRDVMLRVYIDLDKGDSAPLEMVFANLQARHLSLLELGLHIPQEMFRHLRELQPHSLVTIKRLCLLQTMEPGQHRIRPASSSLGVIPKSPEARFSMLPTILSSASLHCLSISLPRNIKEEDLSLLCRLRDLIALSIYQHADDALLYTATHPVNIELHCLKELKVNHPSFLGIQKISCPALDSLDIVDPHPMHVYSFINLGSCSLVNLTLRSDNISSEVVNTFRLLPSLASLRILVAYTADIPALLIRLSLRSSLRGCLCLLPSLRVLDISVNSVWSWRKNEVFLSQFLSARWSVPDVLLKTMVLQWKSDLQPTFLLQSIPSCIHELLDRGGHRLDMSFDTPADGNVYHRLLFLY